METESVVYLTFVDAVLLHIELMRDWRETRYGVRDRTLIESALMRPRQAAIYESADLIRQAATLCYGLVKNHPWVGGNKRTATALVEVFLQDNGREIEATVDEVIELVFSIESGLWEVEEIENWLRRHTKKVNAGEAEN